jgi:hypothetical protein
MQFSPRGNSIAVHSESINEKSRAYLKNGTILQASFSAVRKP